MFSRACVLAALLPGLDPAAAQEKEAWRPPVPPASAERAEERHAMVKAQIARPVDGRTPVKDERVLEAMRTVPRHVFVPEEMRRRAYEDRPLPIGEGQTISQPYIVAMMTELLGLTPESKVLEIGTGSGYQAAVLAHLTPHVYTIEILKPLAGEADRVLKEQKYGGVKRRQGDGYAGWPEAAPFDGIIVTCAADRLPQPLWEQLKPGGRVVIPMGAPAGIQRLLVLEKTADGQRRTRKVMDVLFVPMTGRIRDK